MSEYLLKCHIQTELYKFTFKTSLVDKPLRPVDHIAEKSSIKAVSTPEIRKKTEEGAEKATGNCDCTECAGFAYCQLGGSRQNSPKFS